MTFKAYLENIQAKTGKSPDNFLETASKKGFIKNGKIVAEYADLLAWLMSDVGLERRHANAIIYYLRIRTNDPKVRKSQRNPNNMTLIIPTNWKPPLRYSSS
jgi:hypothetical protein